MRQERNLANWAVSDDRKADTAMAMMNIEKIRSTKRKGNILHCKTGRPGGIWRVLSDILLVISCPSGLPGAAHVDHARSTRNQLVHFKNDLMMILLLGPHMQTVVQVLTFP